VIRPPPPKFSMMISAPIAKSTATPAPIIEGIARKRRVDACSSTGLDASGSNRDPLHVLSPPSTDQGQKALFATESPLVAWQVIGDGLWFVPLVSFFQGFGTCGFGAG
jgi:hypothetical protein